ncbi:DHHA1 domain-containing protein [Methermicoccus shengliensis]|nr:DHH family phosphoesterase [Methermicoccus shengliensis]
MSIEQLDELAGRAAKRILDSSDVRLVSHNDADGIASAGIIAHVLLRAGIPFVCSIVPRLNEAAVERISSQSCELTVLCDMGSGQPELVERLGEAVVLDHHYPRGDGSALEDSALEVNPHHVGIEGSFELCAAGVCYLVARRASQMGGWKHEDLVGLALAGIVGDKQRIQGPNLAIVEEGIKSGYLVPSRGLKVPDYPVEELFMRCYEPYLDITGDEEACHNFAAGLGLEGKRVDELSEEEGRRLADAVALKLLKGAHPTIVEVLVGEFYRAPAELVPNTIELADLIGACGKLDRAGLGVALCLRDRSVLEEARGVLAAHQERVLEEIKRVEGAMREMKWLRWAAAENLVATGVVSSTLLRYRYPPDKPLVLLNLRDSEVRVSARGTRAMVHAGLDLSSALSEAAESVGGKGGGHAVAAGAEIPKGTEQRFIERVHTIVQQQLEGKTA